MALTNESLTPKSLNQRLTDTARSRWLPHVKAIEGGFQGQSDLYRGGTVVKSEACTHKHDTNAAAAKCAEKLGK